MSPSGAPQAAANADTRPRQALSRADYERFSPLIRRQAMLLARKAPKHVTVADLCARGFAGLFEALRNAAAAGAPAELEAFVMTKVKGAMLDFILGQDPRVRRARAASREVARAIRLLASSLGEPPSLEQIAAGLSTTVAELEATLLETFRAGVARVDVVDVDQLGSVRGDDEDESCDLERAVELLPRHLQELLMLVYQADCTLAEAALALGLTETRAQIEYAEAMHRVRASLGKE